MTSRDRAFVRTLWSRRFGGSAETQTNWIDAALDPTHSAVGLVASSPSSGPPAGFSFLDVAQRSFTREYLGLDVLDLAVSLDDRTGLFHLTCVRTDCEGQGVASAFYRRRLEILSEREVTRAAGISWHRPDLPYDSRVLFERWGFTRLATVDRFYSRTGSRPHCPLCDAECTCAASLYVRTNNPE